MHPYLTMAIARERLDDAERRRRHHHHRPQARPAAVVDVRRRLGRAVVAVGERIAAEGVQPRPRGAPPDPA